MAGIRGLIAAIVLGLASLAATADPVKDALDLIKEEHAKAWDAALTLKKFPGNIVPPPQVAYGDLPGAYGSYRIGSGIVLVDIKEMGTPFGRVTLVHEMIHYIQDVQRYMRTGKPTTSVSPAEACHDEEEAYRLEYSYVIITGTAINDFRVKQWDTAMWMYPHCINWR